MIECLRPYAKLIAQAREGTLPPGPAQVKGLFLYEPDTAVRAYAGNVEFLVTERGYAVKNDGVRRNLELLTSLQTWVNEKAAEASQARMMAQPKDARRVLYLAGYAGRHVDDLWETARELDAMIADIRLSPRSAQPGWNGFQIKGKFQARYQHIPELGNERHRIGGEPKIRDLAAGLARLADLPWPPILLCACRDTSTCHRGMVAVAAENTGWRVEDLPWVRSQERRAA